MAKLNITDEYVEVLNSLIVKKEPFMFLTGKAGTGKSTLVRLLERECELRGVTYVKLAPTGIAALNIKGQTIHSFFGFDFNNKSVKGSKKLQEKLEGLDLIIIDEISMVRSDMIDRINLTLQKNTFIKKPFGGIQILAVGDLYQIPPVVTKRDTKFLYDYATPYFFSGHVFADIEIRLYELSQVFRQDNVKFQNLLNAVRSARLGPNAVNGMNKRILATKEYMDNFNGIYLCTLKDRAIAINRYRLSSIDKESHMLESYTTGKFPESIYPTQDIVEIKVGCKVLLCKNTMLYANGQTGIVTKFEDGIIFVTLENGNKVRVDREMWENIEYLPNGEKKVIGTFKQYPIKLGWAITIHKSQGMTITDKVVIDTGNGCFVTGQFYVAMSRITSPDNVKLMKPLDINDIMVSVDVLNFFDRLKNI